MSISGLSMDEIENSAYAVASLITKLIDHLRHCQELAPVPIKSLAQGCSKLRSDNHTQQSDSRLRSFYLYHHLQTVGFTEEINQSIRADHSNLHHHPQLSEPSTHCVELDRQSFVYEILFPLLSSLSYWYNQLDQFPSTQCPFVENDRGKSTKPRPPIGMLSLSNYTDIACLLELTVCSAILPYLEPIVLTPSSAEDRSKYLPKTMAGRIPKRSLYWSYQVHQECIALDVTDIERKRRIIQSKLELMDATIVISQLVLLDRFRHILFRRHITDLFAAFFQIEQYDAICTNDDPDRDLRVMWNQTKSYFIPDLISSSSSSPPQGNIDCHSRAQVYQSLLLGGKNSPEWLKSRVGSLLTQLALSNHEGLQAIIDVFVVAAHNLPTEEITRASSRLGRVLCCTQLPGLGHPNDVNLNYYELLFRNLCLVLESVGVDRTQKGPMFDDVRAMATVLTAWSILDNTPLEAIRRSFLPYLIEGLLPLPKSSKEPSATSFVTDECTHIDETSQIIYRSLLRLYALLLFIPPGLRRPGDITSRICQLLLTPFPLNGLTVNFNIEPDTEPSCLGDVTVFSVLLRVVHAGEKSILKCAAEDVAKLVFHMMLKIILKNWSFHPRAEEVTTEKVLAVSLVKCVMLNKVDLAGWVFCSQTSGESDKALICLIRTTIDENILQYQTECLAELLILNISTAVQSEQGDPRTTAPGANLFPELLSLQWGIFQLLLITYLQFSSSSLSILVPESLLGLSNSSKIVILHLLSLLCEKCSLEKIITDHGTSDSAIRLLHLIITTVVNNFVKTNPGYSCATSQSFIDKSIDFSSCDLAYGVKSDDKSIPISLNNGSNEDTMASLSSSRDDSSSKGLDYSPRDQSSCYVAGVGPMVHDKEAMTSSLTIVLTLLVAILELDSSDLNEEILKSMVSSLALITSPEFVDSSSDDDDQLAIAHSELAEMASHAMASIALRQKSVQISKADEQNGYVDLSTQEMLRLKIRDAAIDLSSTEAPLRAKGVVTLRHLARSSLLEQLFTLTSLDPLRKLSSIRKDEYPLVHDMSGDMKGPDESNNDAIRFLGDMLDLSLVSLSDSESYVYLAGIQTIVVLADVVPYYIIQVLTDAMCTGVASFLISNQPVNDKLSSSQRIKLTEALLFIIRRRGSAIHDHGRYILQSMIYGKVISPNIQSSDAHQSLERSALVQSATHSFFNDSSLALDETIQSVSEEVNIRLATGGPLFDVEEGDLLRSSCIHVASELVLALSPSIVAQYCPTLCRLGLNALRLDDSRVIRRAAAMLCKCLYICASREIELIQQDAIPEFTSSLLSCGEDLLFAVLTQCVSGDDVDLFTDNASSGVLNVVKGKVRLYDEATVARCKEAIVLREELEETGFLDIARTIARSRCDERDTPLVRLLGDIGRPKKYDLQLPGLNKFL